MIIKIKTNIPDMIEIYKDNLTYHDYITHILKCNNDDCSISEISKIINWNYSYYNYTIDNNIIYKDRWTIDDNFIIYINNHKFSQNIINEIILRFS